MSFEARKRRTKYPYGKVRVYWSAIITALSIILALLLLKSPLLLLYYLVLTLVLTAVVLALKIRFLRMRVPGVREEELSETESRAHRWRSLLILFGLLMVFLFLPLLLAKFVHPESWFVSLISYTSGVSTAEVVFFLITRKS